jgi:hypothetical protein
LNKCIICKNPFECSGNCFDANYSNNCMCFDCWMISNYRTVEETKQLINVCKWKVALKLSDKEIEILNIATIL